MDAQTKRLEKKLDGNYTRVLRAILNKSWRQHHTKHQLYGHIPPITKTIQVRRTRHAEHCWRSRDELISHLLAWTPHLAGQKQYDQLEHTYSSSVALKTCQKRWTIGRSGERGSGISMLAALHDRWEINEECSLSVLYELTVHRDSQFHTTVIIRSRLLYKIFYKHQLKIHLTGWILKLLQFFLFH